MALSNLERVTRALDLVDRGLRPWIARTVGLTEPLPDAPDALFEHLLTRWEPEPSRVLGEPGRRLVEDLRATRARTLDRGRFDADQAYRALDDCARLLASVSARDEESEVDRLRQELLRARFDEEARKESRRTTQPELKGTATEGLKPWREVVTPHPDVARGTYQKAEFAADLWAVVTGDASEEYRDAVEFFRRTYLTEGLRQLLVNALTRLSGEGGDPVIELQTTFGGGKTHSMLALYHLLSGVAPTTLPGLEPVLSQSGVSTAIPVRRAVLVGNKLSPGQPEKKPDGTEVRTLWGELAWQLGGREGYDMVRASDETATNPGDALRLVFKRYSPCLVLVDEWVAYARQLFATKELPGGTFETHFTFAQQLSEAAKAAPRTLLVVSIPASEGLVARGRKGQRMETEAHDIEVGGARGQEALERLKNAIGRVESPWRAASAEETYEIVRRRLFQPIADPALFAARDAVIKRFMELYRAHPTEFPSECKEREYERKLVASYPLHPELFDRLSLEWSSLPRFQRTRGVLRLMATVVHRLWLEGDRTLMILPACVPLGAGDVQSELGRYLDDPWSPVLERDVDGPGSVAVRIDEENVLLGKVSAARRVARTIFMATAPVQRAAHVGVEEKQIRLGCAQPGELPAPFSDAIRKLAERGRHLYSEGTRYWFGVQATVSRLADDRAGDLKDDVVAQHLVERLKELFRQPASRGDFRAVYVAPRKSGEVPDEREAGLVVLDPDDPHLLNTPDTPGKLRAQEILDRHGSGARTYRNSLVFLAPDRRRLTELQDAARKFLAWESIVRDHEQLDLSHSQRAQADQRKKSADETVRLRLFETWGLVLYPTQDRGDGQSAPPPLEWNELRLQAGGNDSLGARVSRRVTTEGALITTLNGTVLRLHLDQVPLWRGDHVTLKTLAEDFAKYVYLPRLQRTEVLLEAARQGVSNTAWQTETFAWAERYDADAKRYLGLKAGTGNVAVSAEGDAVLVKSEVAWRQMQSEARPAPVRTPVGETPTSVEPRVPGAERPIAAAPTAGVTAQPREEGPKRFHASVDLELAQLGARADQIAKEVLRHLAALPGARVTVTLEVQAETPSGVPGDVARIVRENCRTLGIDDAGFETH